MSGRPPEFEFYEVFVMPGEGPPGALDVAVFESMFPVEEGPGRLESRLQSVLGMSSSLEVKVFYPT